MKRKPLSLVFLYFLIAHTGMVGQPVGRTVWTPSATPFRTIGTASNDSAIWVCGVDEGIASSSDGGGHWQIKHLTPDGNLLLSIGFVNEKFGYAAGTNGLILTSEDGGETWTAQSGPDKTVLQISYSDSQHGLIRTPDALQFTVNGERRGRRSPPPIRMY